MAKRKINLTDNLEIFNLLRKLQSSKAPIWVFPNLDELTEKSPIHLAKISKIEYDRLEIRPSSGNNFTFEKANILMFFFRDEELAFKTKVTKYNPELISIPFPGEIFSIDETDLEKVPLFNKIITNFQEKRSEKRKNPQEKKYVFVGKETKGILNKSVAKKFELLDLSPSGMGFITSIADDFQIGDVLDVSFKESAISADILYGEVKSIRELRDGGFKIGVLFHSREAKKR
jgi:PilZ domain